MNSNNINSIMAEFTQICGEYLVCLSFAEKGIADNKEMLESSKMEEKQHIWISSNIDTLPKFHANMDIKSVLEKSKSDGYFANEIRKSLLCTIYCLWDENYRHKIAAANGIEAGDIIWPLMGDLRKIRNCILHHKSTISSKGLTFEVLDWSLVQGSLHISHEMFLEFIGAVRERRYIIAARMSPEMKAIYSKMTKKEKENFDNWYKIFEHKISNAPWPGMDNVLERLKPKNSD